MEVGNPPKVPMRPGKTGHDTENKIRAAEDSVQTEEMNIADLEDRIREVRYRQGLNGVTANREHGQRLAAGAGAAGVATREKIQ